MYARSKASAALTGIDRGWSPMANAAREKAREFGLDGFIGCIEYDPARHDDNVDSAGRLMVTEDLSDQPLRAVALYGRT